MGIEMLIAEMPFEINQMLVLKPAGTQERDDEEYLPDPRELREGCTYKFNKDGRRIFPMERKDRKDIEIPLYERP